MSKIDFESYGKSRVYKLLLFADNKDHMRTLNKLKRIFNLNFIGIWHVQFDDAGNEIIEESGKKHAHVMLVFQNPVSWKNLVKKLNADPRFCMPIVLRPSGSDEFVYKKCTVEGGYCYLTHVNTPDKEQYDLSDLWGSQELIESARLAIVAYLSRKSSLSACCVQAIQWIRRQPGIISYAEFTLWLAGTPYFKAGSSPLVRGALLDHNERIRDQLAQNKRRGFEVSNDASVSYGSVSSVVGFDVHKYWKHDTFEDFFDPLNDDEDVMF